MGARNRRLGRWWWLGPLLGVAALGAVLLFAVYWLVLGPVALTLRLLGADLLGVRGARSTAWTPVENPAPKSRLEGAG